VKFLVRTDFPIFSRTGEDKKRISEKLFTTPLSGAKPVMKGENCDEENSVRCNDDVLYEYDGVR
jgi:hypothetical protein